MSDKNFRSSKSGLENPIICYGKGRKEGYVLEKEIPVNTDSINKWKIFTPRANNIGTELNDDNLNSFPGEPNTICTESYIMIGANLNLNRESCEILSKYLKTKFARLMHSIAKASQDAIAKTYRFVPMQDFSINSDIDCNKKISKIDRQLYEKYNLNEEKIKFIEEKIKPMK